MCVCMHVAVAFQCCNAVGIVSFMLLIFFPRLLIYISQSGQRSVCTGRNKLLFQKVFTIVRVLVQNFCRLMRFRMSRWKFPFLRFHSWIYEFIGVHNSHLFMFVHKERLFGFPKKEKKNKNNNRKVLSFFQPATYYFIARARFFFLFFEYYI